MPLLFIRFGSILGACCTFPKSEREQLLLFRDSFELKFGIFDVSSTPSFEITAYFAL